MPDRLWAVADRELAAAGVMGARQTVAEWLELRHQIRALEEAEHPPITDVFGRVWTWIPGGSRDRAGNDSSNLYAHDGMAWPREYVERPDIGLPGKGALENPNYRWCDICRGPSVWLDGRRVPVVTVELAEAVSADG